MQHGLAAGIRLFNRGEYFAAHEVLEDVWRAAPNTDKTFLQGLVQLAVAFHHGSTGNLAGAESVLLKASRNLQPEPASPCGLDVVGLRLLVQEWRQALAERKDLPANACIRFAEEQAEMPRLP